MDLVTMEEIFVELRQKPALTFEVGNVTTFQQVFTGVGIWLGWSSSVMADNPVGSVYDGNTANDLFIGGIVTNSQAPKSQWFGDRGIRIRTGLGVQMSTDDPGIVLYYVCYPYPH